MRDIPDEQERVPGLPHRAAARLADRNRHHRRRACRHLVKDRMDLTGARWGLDGAEAILKLRALHCNGDFDTYWTWHLGQEQQRVHQSRYLNGAVPRAA